MLSQNSEQDKDNYSHQNIQFKTFVFGIVSVLVIAIKPKKKKRQRKNWKRINKAILSANNKYLSENPKESRKTTSRTNLSVQYGHRIQDQLHF